MAIKTIGIRREDKNDWEKRVPLVPSDIAELQKNHGIKTIIQPSEIRIFSDEQYQNAGAEINESLKSAEIIFAVKEIPARLLEPGKTYLFFSHTIKGQPYNIDMLKRLMELKCNLIDYELIVDEMKNRLIAFGRYAGIAGLIETLYAYGRKMKSKGYVTPFEEIKQAYRYASLQEAKEHIKLIGRKIVQHGLPEELSPLTVGFLGYGNVSKGAQEIFDLLPIQTIKPNQLKQFIAAGSSNHHCLYKLVFKEEDLVKPLKGAFNLVDYYNHPEKFESVFSDYLTSLKILINGIYWTEEYPRFVTRKNLQENEPALRNSGLQLIGDISCDISGSIEITKEATMPDNACYTYDIIKDSFSDGIAGSGITVMAIDNLPCEFSHDASCSFSEKLKLFVNDISRADFEQIFDDIKLPEEIKGAMILHKGCLTKKYGHLNQFL